MSQFSPKAIDRFIKAKCYDISHDSAVSCHFSAVVPSMPMPSATTLMNPTWKSCIFPSQIFFFLFSKLFLFCFFCQCAIQYLWESFFDCVLCWNTSMWYYSTSGAFATLEM